MIYACIFKPSSECRKWRADIQPTRRDIQYSLVHAFATFFLLSYVKFFSVSIDILTQANVWDVYDMQQHPVLYYDGTVEYFGREHIPFALLAVCVLILFTFLPILVLSIYYIYPCRCFQRRLDRCHINSLAFHWLMTLSKAITKMTKMVLME